MPLSRELKFTETRPIDEWALTAIVEAITAAFDAARAEGAPESPGTVHISMANIGHPALFTSITWGAKLEFEEPGIAGH